MSTKERAEMLNVPHPSAEMAEDRYAEIYEIRASVRNSLRPFTERYAWLSSFLRTTYMPAVDAENVRQDEDAYLDVLTAKLSKYRLNGDIEDVRVYVRQSRDLLNIPSGQMEGEEKARYLAAKITAYLRCGAYDRVVQFFESVPMVFSRDTDAIRFFVYSVETPIFAHLRSLLVDRRGKDFLQAYLHLGTVMPLEDFDISDFAEELRSDEAFQAVLRGCLGERIKAHPRIYQRTKACLANLGILDEENLESKDEIRDQVYSSILNFATVDYTTYEVIRNLLDEAGLMTLEAINESELLYEAIVRQLEKYMEKSPRLYRKMRDRWVNAGYIYEHEANEHVRIRKALDPFLVKRIEDHPRLYQHFRRMAAFYGVDPYDEKRLKITVKSKEESLKESPWPNYPNEDISRFMNQHSRQCERLLQKHGDLCEDLLGQLEIVLADYEKRFPQLMKGEKSMLGKMLS